MPNNIQIAVVGSGYVGLVAAVCFAEMGHDVICVDNDERKVAALQGGDTLIHENYLPELLQRYRNTKVRFMTDLAEATRECEAIFIAVGTPQSETGDADLSYVEAVACEIARSITSYKVIVEKSTVPVYTNEWIRRAIERNGVARDLFDVVSNPEFLREGTAVADFLHPDRIVVGADSERAAAVLNGIYEPLTGGSYYLRPDAIPGSCSATAKPPLLNTSTKSAEIIKHASNAFLAVKISFINAVSNLCEATDANVEQVAIGMGMDARIGPKFLRPGIGYGGSCFPKDSSSLLHTANRVGYDFPLMAATIQTNEEQPKRFIARIDSVLGGFAGKKIAVLGLAFKANTDDMRDAKSLDVIQAILAGGGTVTAYDPIAMENTKRIFPQIGYAKNAFEAADGVDAVVVVTEWNEFKQINLEKLKSTMAGTHVFDGRNLYDPAKMSRLGFDYYGVGRGCSAHAVVRPGTVRETVSIK